MEVLWSEHTPTDKPDGKPDTAIVPYVNKLQSEGVETYQSCAGHQYEQNGTKLSESGTLWFECEDLDVDRLVMSPQMTLVKRVYKPEQCWEVVFPGHAIGEEAFGIAMEHLFECIDVDLP